LYENDILAVLMFIDVYYIEPCSQQNTRNILSYDNNYTVYNYIVRIPTENILLCTLLVYTAYTPYR
jgi:hypothetical protein